MVADGFFADDFAVGTMYFCRQPLWSVTVEQSVAVRWSVTME